MDALKSSNHLLQVNTQPTPLPHYRIGAFSCPNMTNQGVNAQNLPPKNHLIYISYLYLHNKLCIQAQ